MPGVMFGIAYATTRTVMNWSSERADAMNEALSMVAEKMVWHRNLFGEKAWYAAFADLQEPVKNALIHALPIDPSYSPMDSSITETVPERERETERETERERETETGIEREIEDLNNKLRAASK